MRLSIIITIFSVLFFFLTKQGKTQKVENIFFDHVALPVKKLETSAKFYSSILGLNEITNKTRKDGIRWFSLGEGKELHLISTMSNKVKMNKAIHFAIKAKNFDALKKQIEKQNIPYFNWDEQQNKMTIRADGIKQIYIKDPDGNYIEINSAK